MLRISQISEIFWKFWWIFLNSDRILTEFWCEKFEWFDRSPIEPFNPGTAAGAFPELLRRAPGARPEHGEEAPGRRLQRSQGWKVRSATDRTIRTFHIRIRSKFCQNSGKFIKIFRKFLKFEKFSTFSKVFSEIPRNFRQNRCKIRWKSVEN